MRYPKLWPALVALLLTALAAWAVRAAPLGAQAPGVLSPNDPRLAEQWGLADNYGIRATGAWTITTGGDIVIAVLDAGFDLDHPDLAGRWLDGKDFVDGGSPSTGTAADSWGTGVAAIAAATSANGQGMAGVTWRAKVLPLRVVDRPAPFFEPRYDTQTVSRIAAALDLAVERGARIAVFGFNLSGLTSLDQALLQEAISRNQAPDVGRDLLVIAPVGEQRPGGPPYPAAMAGVLGVTATMTDGLALQSRFTGQLRVPQGDFVDLAAPGDLILTATADANHGYALSSGTEFAAGFAAGAAGLVWSVNPSLPASEVERTLLNTARDLGQPGRDPLYGRGLLDATRAVLATRHFLQVTPNRLVFPADAGALLPLTNRYTQAGSWRVTGAPAWVSVSAVEDVPPASRAFVSLTRVPTCAEVTNAPPITLASRLPLSFDAVEVTVQVEGVCTGATPTPGPSPTPRPVTPPIPLTPTPTAPPPAARLFLPLVEQGCERALPSACRGPR